MFAALIEAMFLVLVIFQADPAYPTSGKWVPAVTDSVCYATNAFIQLVKSSPSYSSRQPLSLRGALVQNMHGHDLHVLQKQDSICLNIASCL